MKQQSTESLMCSVDVGDSVSSESRVSDLQSRPSFNLIQAIVDLYQDDYAMNAIKLKLWDEQRISVTNEFIKRTLNAQGVKLRPPSTRATKTYTRKRGRFEDLK